MRIEIDVFDKSSIREALLKVEGFRKKVSDATETAVRLTAEDLVNEAKELTYRSASPLATGQLEKSWQVEHHDGRSVVYNEDEAAVYFEYGTGLLGKKNAPANAPNGWFANSKDHWIVHWSDWGSPTKHEFLITVGQRGAGMIPQLQQRAAELFGEHFEREMMW